MTTSKTLFHTEQTEPFNWEQLERMDWHLWLLAALLIFILGIGLLSFMVPAAFWFLDSASARGPERAFFGFCILLALVLVYLLQRQAVVRELQRRLFEAERKAQAAEQHAAVEAFLSLPGLVQFRDALAMEFRRASTLNTHLSEAFLRVRRSSPESLGRIAKLLHGMLRRGETLYQISDTVIAVILPGMELNDALWFGQQLQVAIGLGKDELEVTVAAYPDEVSSLAELDGKIRAAAEVGAGSMG